MRLLNQVQKMRWIGKLKEVQSLKTRANNAYFFDSGKYFSS